MGVFVHGFIVIVVHALMVGFIVGGFGDFGFGLGGFRQLGCQFIVVPLMD